MASSKISNPMTWTRINAEVRASYANIDPNSDKNLKYNEFLVVVSYDNSDNTPSSMTLLFNRDMIASATNEIYFIPGSCYDTNNMSGAALTIKQNSIKVRWVMIAGVNKISSSYVVFYGR